MVPLGYYTPMSGLTGSTTTVSNWTTITNSSCTGTWFVDDSALDSRGPHNELTISDGQEKKIKLPDGSIINVAKDGSYTIDDSKAKVIYRANRMRDFNAYLNASDKMEEFIRFCGEHGVRQDEMLEMPVKHFIAFLIVEAAKADKEPDPDVPLIPDLRKQAMQPHCVSCGRFIPRIARQKRIEVCGVVCFERQMERIAA